MMLVPSVAEAARLRPFFEPTDLELEDPGVVDVDVTSPSA
jgi:hypothetical protein